ncbi:uncharacterized protein PV09_03655 [Verruconis gallopava]|uniref:4-coumarate-CoA ligase n=1 Tax=Verruconis gallopava TaxID=253628 RepID=A0A0D2ADN8_9PEZI|nr:uncharacterized protein PV09_03655 [Verruconis gallopava]KIW05098.1 hypothetical protein PV09_03655 [Verruconis gallopava]
MRIIKADIQYKVPQIDLLTFLFDSEYSVSANNAVLHVSAENNNHTINKAQLRQYAEEVAHGLRTNYGIGSSGPYKDVVTVLSSGQPFSPAIFFGIIAAGGVSSYASHSASPQELARQIKQGLSKVVIVSEDLKDVAVEAARICELPPENVLVFGSAPPWTVKSVVGGIAVRTGDEGAPRLSFRRVTDRNELENSLIILIWSSGTTGAPKGVMLSHLNVVTELYIPMKDARDFAEANADPKAPPVELRTIAHLPTAHIAGVLGYLSGPVLTGAKVFWMRKYEWKSFIEYAGKYKPTTLYTVPSIYLRIAKSPEVTDQFSEVVAASTGAAKMDQELQRAANAKMGGNLTFIGQTWGLSETTGAITAQRAGQFDDTGSISPVLPNMQLRLVDDNGNDVEPGQPGELICKGDIVTKGYFNNPSATAEAFHDGWFYTGDVAVEKDGKFYIVDRKKEVFKYKGQQVAPAELEGILNTHPHVKESAVVGVPDAQSGEVPRAYVVADKSSVSGEEIATWLAQRVAPYKQLRGGVVFVDELPKSAIGKILRRELRDAARKEPKTSKL